MDETPVIATDNPHDIELLALIDHIIYVMHKNVRQGHAQTVADKVALDLEAVPVKDRIQHLLGIARQNDIYAHFAGELLSASPDFVAYTRKLALSL